MAERKKGYLPLSTAGLIRYAEAEKGIKLRPEHVVLIALFFTFVVIFARLVFG